MAGGKAAGNVRIYSQGRVLTAPLGSTAPVATDDAWPAAWNDHGYTTQDGITFTPTFSRYQVKAWQSDIAIRSRTTERNQSVMVRLLQSGGLNTILFFGGGTWAPIAAHAGNFQYTPPAAGTDDNRMLGLEFVDGTIIKRLISPIAIVANVAATSLKGTEETRYEVTFDLDTNAWTILSNDPADNSASLAA